MHLKSVLTAALIALAASPAVGVSSAAASPALVWTLSDVVLGDAAVTGSFSFDGTSFGAFNVTSDAVGGYDPVVYDSSAGATADVLSSSSFQLNVGFAAFLRFDFAAPLDGLVSPDAVAATISDVCGDGCIFRGSSGQATLAAVPEPMSLALFATGLAGLSLTRRQRRA